jgi:hypothetical protein
MTWSNGFSARTDEATGARKARTKRPDQDRSGGTKGARTTEPLELADEADRTLVAERRRGPGGGRTGESGEVGRAVSAYGPWKLPPVGLK